MPSGVGRGEGSEQAEGDIGGLHVGGAECLFRSMFVLFWWISMSARPSECDPRVKRAKVNFARGRQTQLLALKENVDTVRSWEAKVDEPASKRNDAWD
jgi:hypothetical protein